jgi:hypothetical protein
MLKKRNIAVISTLVLAALAFLGAFWGIQKVNTKYPWFWMYAADWVRPAEHAKGPKHLMFVFVDHFEPHDQEAMNAWMKGYPEMASKHADSDGKHPQHSWFWFFSESDLAEKKSFLAQLATLSYEGYGEIEFHMHHGNDDEESFLKQMREAISLSNEVGAMVTQEVQPRKAFGFIHGMWSLDNSRGPGFCGINNELILLQRLGCYADFTNPSWGSMHPKMVNRFYYATDDPLNPKSYNSGVEMEAGKLGVGDLFMFTGQSVVGFNSVMPRYDHGEVDFEHLPKPHRVDSWIKNAVSVKGRPEWKFVKVFSHGALTQDHDTMFGEWADRLYSHLEKHYNNGSEYILHYVTAREAFNIAKAAEAQKRGNPDEFRDYLIPPYVNRSLWASVPYEAVRFEQGKAVIRFLSGQGSPVEVRLHGKNVEVSGEVSVVSRTEFENETVLNLILSGNGVVGFSYEA